jgi:hypothetical protein
MPQEYNAQLIDWFATSFPRRLDASYAWARAISGMQLLPVLRGIWSGGGIDEHGGIVDLSEQGRELVAVNSLGWGRYGIVPYINFVRASSAYLSRATEPGLEITTIGLTCWAWVYFDVESSAAETGIISKWYTTGDKRGYLLHKSAGNAFTFSISSSGAVGTVVTIGDVATNYSISKWWFLAGRFQPSTEIALMVGNATTGVYTWYKNVAAIPAAIYKTNEAFEIGRYNRTNYLDGRMPLFGIASEHLTDIEVWNIFSQTRPLFM